MFSCSKSANGLIATSGRRQAEIMRNVCSFGENEMSVHEKENVDKKFWKI